MSKPFKVIISGAGITGSVAAFWLARASTASRPIHITIIERTSATPLSGQGLDVEGPAREIARKMGVFETIKSRATGEAGFRAIDHRNRVYAEFGQGGPTQDIEIMRGDLVDVLTKAADAFPNVEYQYSRSITNVKQTEKNVCVTISKDDGQSYEEEYDVIVAADGCRSRTRGLILESADTKDCVKAKDLFIAYFSIPAEAPYDPYSRFQSALNGRAIWVRPLNEKLLSVYLGAVGDYPILANSLKSRDTKAKRQAWASTFADVKYGLFSRAVEEMQTTSNFYSDQISQVKLPTWSNGRCAVVGDAAYCPAPITGQGTQLAFLGAYVLAGELAANLEDPAAAFEAYDKRLRSHVEAMQQVPFGGKAPYMVCPQTSWGIWLLQRTLSFVAFAVKWNFLPDMRDEEFPLPAYKFG